MITIRLRAKKHIIPLSFAKISTIDFICFLEPFWKLAALPLANVLKVIERFRIQNEPSILFETHNIIEKLKYSAYLQCKNHLRAQIILHFCKWILVDNHCLYRNHPLLPHIDHGICSWIYFYHLLRIIIQIFKNFLNKNLFLLFDFISFHSFEAHQIIHTYCTSNKEKQQRQYLKDSHCITEKVRFMRNMLYYIIDIIIENRFWIL